MGLAEPESLRRPEIVLSVECNEELARIYFKLLLFNILQGFARERREATHDMGNVLRDCISLQFRVVHYARVPLPNTDKHLMDLLGILHLNHRPTDWFRHARLWSRSSDTRLGCRVILLVQPFLLHYEGFCRLYCDSLPCNPYCILGV